MNQSNNGRIRSLGAVATVMARTAREGRSQTVVCTRRDKLDRVADFYAAYSKLDHVLKFAFVSDISAELSKNECMPPGFVVVDVGDDYFLNLQTVIYVAQGQTGGVKAEANLVIRYCLELMTCGLDAVSAALVSELAKAAQSQEVM